MWLRRHEPEVWKRTATVLGSTGYIVQCLTGVQSVDHFSAADGGLGYRLENRNWDQDAFAATRLRLDLMPELRWPTEVIGSVRQGLEALTGLPAGTPVVAGTGDALADLVATGAVEPGDGALLYGTSMSTMLLSATQSQRESVVTVPGWEPGQLVQSAILPVGIGLLEWWSRFSGAEWTSESLGQVDEALHRSEPGAAGLLHLPYISGLRDSELHGSLLGLRAEHKLPDRIRAIVEGLGHALRYQLTGAEQPMSMRAIGGGARGREVVQVLSNVCGFDQQIIAAAGGAAVGAAKLAAMGVGALASEPDRWHPTLTTVRVQTQYRELYERDHHRFREAVRILSGVEALATAKEKHVQL